MPRQRIARNTTPKTAKSIKFDMASDDDIRASARKGYEVAKIFREAGFQFRKVIPAHVDVSVRKLFKLGQSGPNLCLEVSMRGKTEEQKMMLIEEIRDQFLMLPSFILVNDKPYQLDRSNLVHRFLFRPSKDNE
jgi:deoxycytidine triphosphate deaminase